MCGISDNLNNANKFPKFNEAFQNGLPYSPNKKVSNDMAKAYPKPIIKLPRGGRNDIPPPNDFINPPRQGLGNIRFGGG